MAWYFNSTCLISERGVFNNNVRSTDSKYINLWLYFVLYHGICCVTGIVTSSVKCLRLQCVSWSVIGHRNFLDLASSGGTTFIYTFSLWLNKVLLHSTWLSLILTDMWGYCPDSVLDIFKAGQLLRSAVLATKPDSLSLTLRPHGERLELTPTGSSNLHTSSMACIHLHTYTVI